MLGMFAIPQIYRRSLTHKFQEVSAMAPTAISSHRSSVSCGLQLGKSPKKMGGFSSNHVWWLQVVTCTFPARGVQVWARGIQELVLPIACFRTWVIEIYMLALAWRWIWWAPAIVSVLISEYWAKNRGQIHDMECQKSRCHFFVFARFNYIFQYSWVGAAKFTIWNVKG